MPENSGSIPLLLAALIGQSAATFGLVGPLVSANYIGLVLILGIVGALISQSLRQRSNVREILLPGAVGLIFFFVLTQVLTARFGRLLPIEFIMASGDMSLIVALTMTTALSTLLWVTEGATLFSCVWSMAMIGLAATLNLNAITLVCFGIYLLSSLFLMIHQHTLSQAGPQGRALVVKGRLLTLQLRTAALLWLIAAVLGVAVAIPLQMLGRNMSLASVLERLKVTPTQKQGGSNSPRLVFDNPSSFAVGLGPVSDSDTQLFRVTTKGTHYWRARTYAISKGNEWFPFDGDTEGAPIEPDESKNGTNHYTLRPTIEGERTRTERVKAKVEPLSNVRTLIHLAEPRALLSDRNPILHRVDGTCASLGGRIDFAPPPLPYELEAEVSNATPEELNRSSRDYPEEIKKRYLQEPNPRMLDTLAREAIGSERLPYNMAEAIRKFVANRCLYTLEAAACPLGRNPAEWFLNESKTGYCDLYATAVTLLCRAAGIPSRIVTGFNAGEIESDRSDTYLLRERNRHAWCEVYFTGYGWIPFDATVLTVEATMDPLASQPQVQKKANTLPIGPLVLIGIAALGMAGVGTMEILRRRGVLSERTTISTEDRNARRLLAVYDGALHQLRRHGAGRGKSMTVGEHLALVRQQLGDSVCAAYEPLARLSERTLFAKLPTQQSDVLQGQEALSALKAVLKDKKH